MGCDKKRNPCKQYTLMMMIMNISVHREYLFSIIMHEHDIGQSETMALIVISFCKDSYYSTCPWDIFILGVRSLNIGICQAPTWNSDLALYLISWAETKQSVQYIMFIRQRKTWLTKNFVFVDKNSKSVTANLDVFSDYACRCQWSKPNYD